MILKKSEGSAIIDTELFQQVLQQIREEFDDHLEAINDNTNEIQANASYISELDAKINKLDERLEKIESFLTKEHSFKPAKLPNYNIKNLTEKEKDIFLILYTLDSQNKKATYRELQKRTGLPKTLIQGYITSLIEKGIPIHKQYLNNKVHLKLDTQFKALQAKQNLVKLEQKTLNHIL
ncbi:MAG: hypothetical protein QF632_01610 [Candidatus Woesearchaeota archaeon]|nr:hypothetical protein [Candidatus Woesearchaeota archaeon]MDP7458249.1 hypothetical protein [Candidatus Woesearchaeota archaeon]